MAADVSGGGPELPQWMVTLGVGAMTFLGGIFVALINRSPAMRAAIDASTRTLIDGYEKRVADLSKEVGSLCAEIVSLRKALTEATGKAPPPMPPPMVDFEEFGA